MVSLDKFELPLPDKTSPKLVILASGVFLVIYRFDSNEFSKMFSVASAILVAVCILTNYNTKKKIIKKIGIKSRIKGKRNYRI